MKAKMLWNTTKKWAVELAPQVKRFLSEKGVKVVSSKADFTIIIGGDGTILYYKEKIEGPVFAIGSRRSFICQCTSENWMHSLPRFLSRPSYEERMVLGIKAGGKAYSAINDAAILSKSHQMVELSVDVGGDVCVFNADGVVVSTPTGSTAYAYSAGGPVIEPTLQVMGIVPVCPDKRLFDPLVVSASHKVAVSASSPARLVIDGAAPLSLRKGEKVLISRRSSGILFAVK